MKFRFFFFVLILSACTAGDAGDGAHVIDVAATVTPNEVTAFGYDRLRVVADAPIFTDDARISVYGNAALDVDIASAREASFTWQGSPEATADILVETGGRRYRIARALTVRPPAHPAFTRMVSIGASYGQGVISAGFDADTQRYAPSAQLARQLGAYFPLPLTERKAIPTLVPEDFKGCDIDDLARKEILNFDRLYNALADQQGRTRLAELRLDPHVRAQNAAVGGSVLGGVVHGTLGYGQDILLVLDHVIYDPDVDWVGALQPPAIGSQLDYALSLRPTMLVTVDSAGNDVLPAIGGLDAAKMPSDTYFHQNYRELFGRLDPETLFFIADLPDITYLPGVNGQREHLVAEGKTDAEVDARLQALRDRVKEINAILAEEAAPYPNVVIVKFSEELEKMAATGETLNGEHFTIGRFGGLISLDGLHLTRVGYALIANGAIRAINAHLGTKVREIDLEAVAAVEPETPAHLAPYGLTPANCP